MNKISKELIESYRKIVLPFVSNRLYKTNFEGQGETDKAEFEHDFNEILDLAISALNPTGDLISREWVKAEFKHRAVDVRNWKIDALNNSNEECAIRADAVLAYLVEVKGVIDNAPTVPQVTVFTENADEKAVADLKAELQSVIEPRPKGEYVDISKLRLMTVEECAGHTIDYAMGWKACIEWIKKGGVE